MKYRVLIFRLVFILLMLPWISLQASEKAPDFSVQGVSGEVNLSDYRGQVVYLDFWATWCPPCRKSFPWMNEMQARYQAQGFKVIAISLDRDPETAKALAKELKAEFTVGFDPKGEVASSYKVRAMPSSYLIDREGNIEKTHLGFFTVKKPDYEAAIQALVTR